MPKVTVCMNTARGNYPMVGYPLLHTFEYFMRSLRNQTFKDFEVVICDILYDLRSNYFIQHQEDFVVKHVPIKPNVWTSRGMVAISTTKNTCLLYADGEIVIFTDDGSALSENYIEKVLEKVSNEVCVTTTYNIYCGEKVTFVDDRKETFTHGAYGNIAMPMEAFLKVNGYNEMFDGTRGLEDCEFSFRVFNAGYKWYLQKNPVIYQQHNQDYPSLTKRGPRCPRLMEVMTHKFRPTEFVANKKQLSEEEYKFLLQCHDLKDGYICPYLKKPCGSYLPKDEVSIKQAYEDMKLYNHSSLFFDLVEQRKNVEKTIKDLDKVCSIKA